MLHNYVLLQPRALTTGIPSVLTMCTRALRKPLYSETALMTWTLVFTDSMGWVTQKHKPANTPHKKTALEPAQQWESMPRSWPLQHWWVEPHNAFWIPAFYTHWDARFDSSASWLTLQPRSCRNRWRIRGLPWPRCLAVPGTDHVVRLNTGCVWPLRVVELICINVRQLLKDTLQNRVLHCAKNPSLKVPVPHNRFWRLLLRAGSRGCDLRCPTHRRWRHLL